MPIAKSLFNDIQLTVEIIKDNFFLNCITFNLLQLDQGRMQGYSQTFFLSYKTLSLYYLDKYNGVQWIFQ